MNSLPKYARKAFEEGREFVTSLDNPRRKAAQKDRFFKLDEKSYDLDRPDVLGVPYIYTIEEIEYSAFGTEETVINTFEFETVE